MAFAGRALFGTLAVAAALAACASSSSDAEAVRKGSFDGTTFAVSVRPDGEEPMADRLVFSNGWLESTTCTRAGFNLARYSSGPEGNGMGFTATCESPTMGRNAWHGVVVGDHVEGTLVRTPKDGSAPVHFTFVGDRER